MSDIIEPPKGAEWNSLSLEQKKALAERKAEEYIPEFMNPTYKVIMGMQTIEEYNILLEFIPMVVDAIRKRIPKSFG